LHITGRRKISELYFCTEVDLAYYSGFHIRNIVKRELFEFLQCDLMENMRKVSIGNVPKKLLKEGQWNFTKKNNYRELLEWFSL
jgi:hypothetical protein